MSVKARFALLMVSLFVVATSGTVQPAVASCDRSPDRVITYFEGYGFACAGYGSGCTECADEGTGASCVTTGRACVPSKV